MMTPERRRTIPQWTDVTAVALPIGWVNIFNEDGEDRAVACPALLLQECRADLVIAKTPMEREVAPGKLEPYIETESWIKPRTPPYDSRVVAADFDGAQLVPAADLGDYVATLTQGEFAPKSTR